MGWRRGWAWGRRRRRRGIEIESQTNEGSSLHAAPLITSCMHRPRRPALARALWMKSIQNPSVPVKEELRAPCTFTL